MFKEKRLQADIWKLEGRHQNGSHFPLAVFTDNICKRSEVGAARRNKIRADRWQQRKGEQKGRGKGRGGVQQREAPPVAQAQQTPQSRGLALVPPPPPVALQLRMPGLPLVELAGPGGQQAGLEMSGVVGPMDLCATLTSQGCAWLRLRTRDRCFTPFKAVARRHRDCRAAPPSNQRA